MKQFRFLFIFVLIWQELGDYAFAIDKYAGEFLKYGSSVREMSLGGAMLAAPTGVAAAYWNAAALASNQRLAVQLMHAEEFAGILQFDQVAVAFPATESRSWGGCYLRLSVADIPDTRRALLDLGTDGLGPGDANYPGPDPDGTEGNGRLDRGERLDLGKIKTFGVSQSALLLSTSRQISPRLAVGLTWKQVFQSLYTDQAYGLGFDLAAGYQISSRLCAALVLNDITTTFIFWRKGRRELIAPAMRLGLVYADRLGTTWQWRIGLASDWLFEGETEAADLHLGKIGVVRGRLGAEMVYENLVAFRVGRDDLGAFQLGVGLQSDVANLDYGFAFGSSFSTLGNSHRLALILYPKELAAAIKRHI